MSNLTKIFVLYHKQSPVFKSDIFEPIQTGCADNDLDLGMLKDNSGDNISYKNKHYGELSAWYWVWKNYLPRHPELEYVGFSHYRRFLDFLHEPENSEPFCPIKKNEFAQIFESYTSSLIENILKDYDVILPQELYSTGYTVQEQYLKWHPSVDLDNLIKIYEKEFSQNYDMLRSFFDGNKMYTCLLFVMRRSSFEKLCEWMFNLLFRLETISNWEPYTDYASIRVAAFLAERFFNIWIHLQGFKIKEVNSYLLCDELPKTKNETQLPQKKSKKYDFIFSLGEACSSTQAIRSANLQFASYPLDWLFGANFSTRVNILLSGFERFIEKNDLTYTNHQNGDKHNPCNIYYNQYNNLVFNHDFSSGVPFEKAFLHVSEKYNRRVSRLLNNIEKAKSILIVYIETPNCQQPTTDEEIVTAFSRVKEHYPDKKINLLYFHNDCEQNTETYNVIQLSPFIEKVITNYKSKDSISLPYAVNNQILVKFLRKYRLNLSFSFRIRKFCIFILVKCVPFKFLRKKLRKKYHI